MEPLDYRERRYLSAVEAAKFLGVSVRFVHQMVSEGSCPCRLPPAGSSDSLYAPLNGCAESMRREMEPPLPQVVKTTNRGN